jgi:putative nucleotidyltransferase with HDIG domain
MSLKRLRRAIQAIVDLTLQEEKLLLSLVNLKDCGAPGSSHSVNVAILAVALGAKLGLSKRLLSDLGFAALLHDVGRAQLPAQIQSACLSDLTAEDLKVERSHVFKGVKLLLGENMSEATVKCINVAFLHHYRHDRTGHPRLLVEKEQNLFTRIVAVASHYDDATAAHRLSAEAQDPEAVLRAILEGSGTEFDPLVVKAFVNLMGLYPMGCMVRLDTGEIATVIAAPADARFLDRPTVRLLGDGAGNERLEVCNLLERDKDGRFRRSIVKLYQQKEVNLELEEYLGVI